ncbi:MAG: Rne/Rng family ribonuclease [Alphaproteobacteria bacterium]|nr:Rne/Rng family ribonuclease [Alphaproteobacteria bacterium]
MAKKMLIDAAHPEETRVVVLDGSRVDDFDFETQNKKQLRGNIYLAKVTRVEPSLQAAFVEFGGNRHGFLAFSEIHPDYYQIPTADREALKAEVEAADAEGAEDEEEDEEAAADRRRRLVARRYKIQEVIRRRQIMLVQVVKEERGNKGAALTTYLSLAGRYCVLMPNTGRGGGISRKISSQPDRKRLKKIADELEVPNGMGLIIRTAGAKRTKTEIKRDYEYLTRAWDTIRDATLRSIAPALIYEESSLVKRAIRDLYDKDVEEVLVDGEGAYREAKDFVRMLMPSHAKRVTQWRETTPIFAKHGVERQLDSIYSPVVTLRSGGYIVINQTEALVSIDVNSGRATRERNIEQTALKTNLEAAEEAARQMRLRDLAGLIVIDFIDMEESKNDRQVEKRMKDALRFDRARVQMGKISGFGLLELSRQRRRTGILEGSSHVCEHCAGTGRMRSVESSALALLRGLEDASARRSGDVLEVRAPNDVALYVLNEKRGALAVLEEARNVRIRVVADAALIPPHFEIESAGAFAPESDEEAEAPRAARAAPVRAVEEEDEPDIEEIEEDVAAEANGRDGDGRRRRRRGRRGGRRAREDAPQTVEAAESDGEEDAETETPFAASARDVNGRRKRRRRGRGRRPFGGDGGEALDFAMTDVSAYAPAPTVEAPPPAANDDADADDIGFDAAPAANGHDAPAKPAPAEPEAAPIALVAAAEERDEPAIEAPEAEPAFVDDPYEPDQERREKFFSRLSRWGKKG